MLTKSRILLREIRAECLTQVLTPKTYCNEFGRSKASPTPETHKWVETYNSHGFILPRACEHSIYIVRSRAQHVSYTQRKGYQIWLLVTNEHSNAMSARDVVQRTTDDFLDYTLSETLLWGECRVSSVVSDDVQS